DNRPCLPVSPKQFEGFDAGLPLKSQFFVTHPRIQFQNIWSLHHKTQHLFLLPEFLKCGHNLFVELTLFVPCTTCLNTDKLSVRQHSKTDTLTSNQSFSAY